MNADPTVQSNTEDQPKHVRVEMEATTLQATLLIVAFTCGISGSACWAGVTMHFTQLYHHSGSSLALC